jgi:hypothetical protein
MSTKKPENVANEANPKFAGFAMWMAVGTIMGEKLFDGVTDQKSFSEKYKVNQATLSRWKDQDHFWSLVTKLRQRYWKGRIGNVMLAVENKALREGNAPEAKLLLQVAGEMEQDGAKLQVPENLQKALDKINKLLP